MILISAAPIRSQSAEEMKASINRIKMDAEYIYGQSFDIDENEAYSNALSELADLANEMREMESLQSVYASELSPFAKSFTYTHGDKTCVFLYISVEEALTLPVRASNSLSATSQQSSQSAVLRPSSNTGNPAHSIPSSSPCAPAASNDVLRTLCSQDNWIEIKGFMKTFKDEGKIKEIGNCLSPADVPADAYSILIDDMYGILAILYPKNSPARLNARTNQPDNESNYPNCKIIVWYK